MAWMGLSCAVSSAFQQLPFEISLVCGVAVLLMKLFKDKASVPSSTASRCHGPQQQQRAPIGPGAPLPPTPGVALPLLGHLYMLEANPRKQFMEWGERLGPVYSLYMGSHRLVVLHGYDVIKEALVGQGHVFCNRPYTYISSTLSKHTGFVTPGDGWQTQRKLSVDIMRRLGHNSGPTESRVEEESRQLTSQLMQHGESPIDPRDLVANSVAGVIYSLLFGADFSMEEPETQECVKMIADQAVLLEGMVALDFIPVLRWLPGDLFGLHRAMSMRNHVDDQLIKPRLAERLRQVMCEEPRDFLGHYIQEMVKGDDPDLNEDNLVAVVFTILVAAVDTATLAVLWAVLYLLHHPKVMDRCHQEVKVTVGSHRRPGVKDTRSMPYVEATVLEVLRRASISPFGIHHTVTQDVVLRGFHIPANTIILPHLDSANLCARHWGDPLTFRPERFLDESGGKVKVIHHDHNIPFSMGPRTCFGEKLSKMILTVFLTSIIQEFHIQPAEPDKLPPLQDKFGLNCQPLPFSVRFVPRG